MIGWMPAASVFFQDPDANLLEFIAMLPDAPRAEAGVMTYSNWQALHNRRRVSSKEATSQAPKIVIE